MSKIYNVRITSGTALGPYTIYWDLINPNNYATRVSTSLPATGITYADLTSVDGVTVTIPDDAIEIILYNVDCGTVDSSNSPVLCYDCESGYTWLPYDQNDCYRVETTASTPPITPVSVISTTGGVTYG